ncbi:MAG: hypothetical protein LIP00_12345 [Parabacteroides sp.]|nr:hypothetical protein [Parabacteroides sp.]
MDNEKKIKRNFVAAGGDYFAAVSGKFASDAVFIAAVGGKRIHEQKQD